MGLLVTALLLVLVAAPAHDSAVAKRAPAPQCSDGLDNDGDGQIDYPGDGACVGPYDNGELSECSDGLDNNGDGVADFPNDEACFSAEQDREQDIPATPCADGYDNDLDGKIDFPADPGCASPSDATETREKGRRR